MGCKLRTQDLQGNAAAKAGVRGFVHRSHCTTANDSNNAISPAYQLSRCKALALDLDVGFAQSSTTTHAHILVGRV